jgi:hypothetical protein
LPFGLKNALLEFKKVMDQMLAGFGFANATLMTLSYSAQHQRIIGIICRRYSKDLKIITLSFIQASASFFRHMWNTWVTRFI